MFAIVWDYVFADDEREANPTSFKFLQMAHAWKAKKEGGSSVDAFVSSTTANTTSADGSLTTTQTTTTVTESTSENSRAMDVDDADNAASDVASSDDEES